MTSQITLRSSKEQRETAVLRVSLNLSKISGRSRPYDKGGGQSSRPLEKGGQSPKFFFSALLASAWSQNKGGQSPLAPPLDPALKITLT